MEMGDNTEDLQTYIYHKCFVCFGESQIYYERLLRIDASVRLWWW